jgi:uncharacterized protein (DUF1330 family)
MPAEVDVSWRMPIVIGGGRNDGEGFRMAAYMILIRDEPVRDEAAMAEYQRMNREAANEFSAKLTPLVLYGAVQALEGAKPDGVIVLRFPTVEDAKAWYESPAYQASLPYRKKAADYRAIVVQGV